MDDNPAKSQLRRERRQNRLPANAACILCGYSAPEALIAVNRTLLEKHHVAGKKNAPNLIATVCRNCHAVLTSLALDVGASMKSPVTVLHRHVAIKKGLGTFLIFAGQSLVESAENADRLIAALDKDHPGWRDMPEVK